MTVPINTPEDREESNVDGEVARSLSDLKKRLVKVENEIEAVRLQNRADTAQVRCHFGTFEKEILNRVDNVESHLKHLDTRLEHVECRLEHMELMTAQILENQQMQMQQQMLQNTYISGSRRPRGVRGARRGRQFYRH